MADADRDITGDGVCGWCGARFPVASLARECEVTHLEVDDAE